MQNICMLYETPLHPCSISDLCLPACNAPMGGHKLGLGTPQTYMSACVGLLYVESTLKVQ